MITGATGGIGRAIAERLAHTDYRLTLSGRDEAALAKLASDLAGPGAELQVVPADMTSEDDVRELARSHAERFGSMDLLVLSAGTGTTGSIADYPMRRFDQQMTVNVRAPFARSATAPGPEAGTLAAFPVSVRRLEREGA